MSTNEDLIDFAIIEDQKENIQPLASGRSAKALVSSLGTATGAAAPTLNDTRNLNDAIREEYEIELRSMQDSDDPLDIYDRYIKWTLSAYPSAQATTTSQLRPLLERATKAFQSIAHYKNDPRYLKIWLHYIRLFSDSPRETFTYLSRHGIGESLAPFYEEFAVWLEGAGRWLQADEVYKLGIAREALPVERLVRKYSEFRIRFETRAVTGEEPASPALPTVRPALATKVDPFSSSTPRSQDTQAARSAGNSATATNRNGKQKLMIFSDNEDKASPNTSLSAATDTKGWQSMGSAADRKKENLIVPKPWTGETIRTTKRAAGGDKLTVFKDESRGIRSEMESASLECPVNAQNLVKPRSSKIERVFAHLHAVYPDENQPQVELSFEELRAQARGWLSRNWKQADHLPYKSNARHSKTPFSEDAQDLSGSPSVREGVGSQDSPCAPKMPEVDLETTIAIDIAEGGKLGRPKKVKVKEIRGATQTIKTNLQSPTGPKIKRRQSSEPTMTLHTKAATDDILDIFNQPLRNCDPLAGPSESDGETDYDDDDDYTSAGESTGTGRISGASDFGETEPDGKTQIRESDSAPDSVSPWSDFTASKLANVYKKLDIQDETSQIDIVSGTSTPRSPGSGDVDPNSAQEMFSEASLASKTLASRFALVEPDDYQPPVRAPRDPAISAQNRLPFMTPIIEKTETSAGIFSTERVDTCVVQTPSRKGHLIHEVTKSESEPLSSPLQELVADNSCARAPKLKAIDTIAGQSTEDPIIPDAQCNPVDESIRKSILENSVPNVGHLEGYHKHDDQRFDKSSELRKFIKSLAKTKSSEKTTSSLNLPPTLTFPSNTNDTFHVRRELGRGAFAPVYLAEQVSKDSAEPLENFVAIKSEHPPTAWEFFIMKVLHLRLHHDVRAVTSILRPISMHLFKDEGYLIEEYCCQGTLLDLVNLAKSDPLSGQITLDESVAMFFTIELLRTVNSMHRAGVLHGDLKADNCLVRLRALDANESGWEAQYQASGNGGWSSKGMTLIDFGRSIDMKAFRSNVQFIADWKAGKQDCIEMRELRPWTYQIDYYGIAGVVHSLLFGKYIEDASVDTRDARPNDTGLGQRKQYRVKENLKRYWQTELWTRLFDLTLNPLSHVQHESSASMPCLNGLGLIQKDMESWLEGEGCRKNGGLKASLIRLESRLKEKKAR